MRNSLVALTTDQIFPVRLQNTKRKFVDSIALWIMIAINKVVNIDHVIIIAVKPTSKNPNVLLSWPGTY